MIYLLISQVLSLLLSLLLDLFTISRRSERHKDLQILLLRHQLRIMQRQHPQKPNISRLEKLTVAVLAAKLAAPAHGAKAKLEEVLLLFKPDTPWLCREPWCCAGIANLSGANGTSPGDEWRADKLLTLNSKRYSYGQCCNKRAELVKWGLPSPAFSNRSLAHAYLPPMQALQVRVLCGKAIRRRQSLIVR